MTSFFWSTLLLVATGATARKEFSYDVILFGVPCYWLLQVLQVLQLARSSYAFGYDLDMIILCALNAAKAHKKSLFERQTPVSPLRNCESKNLGFKGETSGIKINIKIHYLSRDLR